MQYKVKKLYSHRKSNLSDFPVFEKYGKNVAIIGASGNHEKYSNKALHLFIEKGFNVFPVNPNETVIDGIKTYHSLDKIDHQIDFISVYLNPESLIRSGTLDNIIKRKVKAVVLNPGTERDDIIKTLNDHRIEIIMACSIVTLNTKKF